MKVLDLLSFLTLLADVFLVFLFLFFLVSKLNRGVKKYWQKLIKLLSQNGLLFAFLIAFVATSGSLFSSEVAKFTPCVLCWYQRVFMYPLAVVLGVAFFKKTKDVFSYAFPLSVIGGVIAAYHYYLQMSVNAFAPCSSIGFSVSCSDKFIAKYGFITIPWMSVTGFILIILFLYLSHLKTKNK